MRIRQPASGVERVIDGRKMGPSGKFKAQTSSNQGKYMGSLISSYGWLTAATPRRGGVSTSRELTRAVDRARHLKLQLLAWLRALGDRHRDELPRRREPRELLVGLHPVGDRALHAHRLVAAAHGAGRHGRAAAGRRAAAASAVARRRRLAAARRLARLAGCLLYTSPSPRDGLLSRMPSSA